MRNLDNTTFDDSGLFLFCEEHGALADGEQGEEIGSEHAIFSGVGSTASDRPQDER